MNLISLLRANKRDRSYQCICFPHWSHNSSYQTCRDRINSIEHRINRLWRMRRFGGLVIPFNSSHGGDVPEEKRKNDSMGRPVGYKCTGEMRRAWIVSESNDSLSAILLTWAIDHRKKRIKKTFKNTLKTRQPNGRKWSTQKLSTILPPAILPLPAIPRRPTKLPEKRGSRRSPLRERAEYQNGDPQHAGAGKIGPAGFEPATS